METSIDAPAALPLDTAAAPSAKKVLASAEKGISSSSTSRHPELEYLKAVNSVAPPKDPQLLFLLMAAVLEREPAGRGRRVFLGATEGIRTAFDGRPKSAVSERDRALAGPACLFGPVAAAGGLRERHDRHIGSSQAAIRRGEFSL